MKIKMIYQEDMINDMSRDRVHLDLSYQEYRKLVKLVNIASWISSKDPTDQYARKLAKNISSMINHAGKLKSIWVNKEGRAK